MPFVSTPPGHLPSKPFNFSIQLETVVEYNVRWLSHFSSINMLFNFNSEISTHFFLFFISHWNGSRHCVRKFCYEIAIDYDFDMLVDIILFRNALPFIANHCNWWVVGQVIMFWLNCIGQMRPEWLDEVSIVERMNSFGAWTTIRNRFTELSTIATRRMAAQHPEETLECMYMK